LAKGEVVPENRTGGFAQVRVKFSYLYRIVETMDGLTA
jgi:hypothetical protein